MRAWIVVAVLFSVFCRQALADESPILLPNTTPRLARYLEQLPLKAQQEIARRFRPELSYDLIGSSPVPDAAGKAIVEIELSTESSRGVLVFLTSGSDARFLFLDDLPYRIPDRFRLSDAEKRTIALVFARYEKTEFKDRDWARMWFSRPSVMTSWQLQAYRELGMLPHDFGRPGYGP
ncbi:hypothetical protein MAMC_01946 [Methylacidimicrobium cyclopophantes]|uniref:Uncharacterized protein n=1 Tax=Methylacidimicrobium cyclopophantes TaxID=1041766 RepID=A0A5E6MGA4_9BACT|nr:hypothetical protein [Methylacidimicrobium cyclopophantes]VVM08042.1 hypothetical protein MAMC_01946 [Methylacidimicrobium cyclopophantes]